MTGNAVTTPYEMLGGAAPLEAIVRRFYALMDGDGDYAGLRAMHADDLEPMRRSLAGFLTAWMGGPRDWFTDNPGACVMSAHRRMTITPDLARQWIDAMTRAIEADPAIQPEFGQSMAGALANMARAMVAPVAMGVTDEV